MTTRRTPMNIPTRINVLCDLFAATRPEDAKRRAIIDKHIGICERAQARAEDTAIARFKMSTARAFLQGLN